MNQIYLDTARLMTQVAPFLFADAMNCSEETARHIKATSPVRIEPLIDSIRRAGSSNFETDMNTIESMMTLAPPNCVENALEALQIAKGGMPRPRSPVSPLIHIRSIYEALYDRNTLKELMRQRVKTIFDEIKQAQEVLSPNASQNVNHFLSQMEDAFEIALYSFNYDTILDDSIVSGNGSFEDGFAPDGEIGRFNPRQFLDAPGLRLAHLHGCTAYRVIRSPYEIVKLLGTNAQGYDYIGESNTQAGDFALLGPIVTGLRKADKTRHEPFGTYAYALERDLLTSERVLLIGYGGSDIYFNQQLIRARTYHGQSWKPAIITRYTPRRTEKLAFLVAAFGNLNEQEIDSEMAKFTNSPRGRIGPLHLDTGGWGPNNTDQALALIDHLR